MTAKMYWVWSTFLLAMGIVVVGATLNWAADDLTPEESVAAAAKEDPAPATEEPAKSEEPAAAPTEPAKTEEAAPAEPAAATEPAAAAEPAAVPATEESVATEVVVSESTAGAPLSPKPWIEKDYDTGSTTWLLISAALVFFMMPGLALFYGGMCRAKNLLNMFMCVMVCVPLVCVEWVAYGYNMAFSTVPAIFSDAGKDDAGKDKPPITYLGWDSTLLFLSSFAPSKPTDTGPDSYGKIVTSGDTVDAAPTGVPELLFAMFQMMFAIITPALIIGAIAERVKFSAWCVFVVLWATLIYNPVAHWVWNVTGFLFQKGVLDFAGGTVVHLIAGVSALALILILPKRRGYPSSEFVPHSVGWTLIGAGFLMVGWFGFNAGSAIAIGKDFLPVSGAVAVMAFASTAIAGSAATGSWMFAEWLMAKKPTALGVASGMVAGLVVITPCAGHVSPAGALVIGLIGGVVCFLAVQAKQIIKYDDSLDVVGVHGAGGLLGALLVGLFAVRPVTGGMDQFMLQVQGVLYTGIYAFVGTLIIGLLIHKTIGFTVSERTEYEGLDITEHGESAYRLN